MNRFGAGGSAGVVSAVVVASDLVSSAGGSEQRSALAASAETRVDIQGIARDKFMIFF
jgi:hypothetical protein